MEVILVYMIFALIATIVTFIAGGILYVVGSVVIAVIRGEEPKKKTCGYRR